MNERKKGQKVTFIGYSRKIIVNLSFEVIKIDLIEDINKEKKMKTGRC